MNNKVVINTGNKTHTKTNQTVGTNKNNKYM